MRTGATTPEELENLLEDASVLGDPEAASELFEEGALLVETGEARQARGRDEIARCVTDVWRRRRTYLADPRRIVQTRDIALVVSGWSVSVMRRGTDGSWRYVVSLPSWHEDAAAGVEGTS